MFCAGERRTETERRCEPDPSAGVEEDAGGELLLGLGMGPVRLEVWAEALLAAEALSVAEAWCAAEVGAAEDGGSGTVLGGLTGFV